MLRIICGNLGLAECLIRSCLLCKLIHMYINTCVSCTAYQMWRLASCPPCHLYSFHFGHSHWMNCILAKSCVRLFWPLAQASSRHFCAEVVSAIFCPCPHEISHSMGPPHNGIIVLRAIGSLWHLAARFVTQLLRWSPTCIGWVCNLLFLTPPQKCYHSTGPHVRMHARTITSTHGASSSSGSPPQCSAFV